jgi:hypothetical protein
MGFVTRKTEKTYSLHNVKDIRLHIFKNLPIIIDRYMSESLPSSRSITPEIDEFINSVPNVIRDEPVPSTGLLSSFLN